MTDQGKTVVATKTKRTVKPANVKQRLIVSIPLALLGIGVIAYGAIANGLSDGVRIALILTGAGLTGVFGNVAAGALGVGPGGQDGSVPGANYGVTEEIATNTTQIEGQTPPKDGEMPPKG